MSSNQLAFLQWPTYDQCITGTKHLSLHLLNRAFCAKDNVATPWYAVKYCMCNEKLLVMFDITWKKALSSCMTRVLLKSLGTGASLTS